MALVPKIDPNKIFASNAPTQDKPAAFDNYEKGMDETRKNLGRPTIKQLNYLHQTADQKILWIHQNGGGLPYDASIEYAENAVTVKDGELKQLADGTWVEVKTKALPATSITTANSQNQQQINDFGGAKWYAKSGGYKLGATVKLDNGEIAKSTALANTVNPNVDMTGWIFDKYVVSITDIQSLKLTQPQLNVVQTVKSYNPDNSIGGGQFICLQSDILTEDLGVVFRSSVVGYEDYFWVRINFDVLTPEMCGAGGTLQDSTDSIERFLNLCGKGHKGQAVSGKVYKTNKTISATYSTSVNVNFNGASIKPFFNLVAGGGAQATIVYSHISGDFIENVAVKIYNLFIDLTDFTPVVSTSVADRQGMGGLVINHPEKISLSNYKCKGAFYSVGLMLNRYRYANLESIHLPECGMKITPTQDNTGDYDSSGDAIFLLDIIGHGQTTIKNLYAKSQDGYLGRIGVVTEQFAGRTDSHLVTLENAHFDGYHRVIHQEDGGKARCVWNGGSAKRFSNLVYNLGGIANKNYFDAYDLNIEVDPPFDFGGTSGTTCFQGHGDTYYTNCDTTYKKTVSERGNKFITGGHITIENGVTVGGVVSTKTHTLTNVDLVSNGGLLRFDAGNKGVVINGGTIAGVSGTMTRVTHSVNGLIKIGGNCKMTDASVSGENTITVNRDKNILSDVEIVYTGATNATLFNSSYQSAFKLNNVNIKSANAKLTLFGDATTRYSINASELVNVAIESVNADTTSVNGICKIKGSELYYNDNYGQVNPFTISSGALVAVLSGNTIFDATTAQNISLPVESGTFKYAAAGNVMVKNSGVTVL